MGMQILWRIDSDQAAITANSTASGTLASNVSINTLSNKWQSDGTLTADFVSFDFGTDVDPTSIGLVGHNLQSTDLIVLRFAHDPAFTIGAYTEEITWREGIIFQILTNVVPRRYIRIEVYKGVDTSARYIGRAMLGDNYELTYSLRAPGYKIGAGKTTTRTVRTQGGQLYADMGTTLKQMKGKIPGLPQADHDELQELIDTNQTGIPFIAAAEYDTFPEQKTIYGTFDTIPHPTDVTINRWEYPWSMTEQK